MEIVESFVVVEEDDVMSGMSQGTQDVPWMHVQHDRSSAY
jgi:hypothetical protein